MELVKNRIHMNQFKGNASTQITLDDDFIVPDTLDDMAQVMLRSGEIQIESVKNLEDKVAVKGKLEFNVLYRREGGGLLAMAGSIPFEESLNVQELDEKDYIGVSWILEDLSGEMINSRKLGIQAIVTLQVRIETLREVEAAVDVKTQEGDEGLQVLKQTVTAAVEACLSRRDGEAHDKMVQKALFFGGTLVCFHLGVAAGYGLWLLWGIRSIWACALPLCACALLLAGCRETVKAAAL